MSDNPSGALASDRIVNQILLDIKSLMLLSSPASDESVTKLVEEKIAYSRDEEVVRFLGMVQPEKRVRSIRGPIFAALGEMILASFFVIVGFAILAPTIMGLGSPSQLSSYFTRIISSLTVQRFEANPVMPLVEFVLALILLLGAFYNLRSAATSLDAVKHIVSADKQ
jgi:hypothetical protein